MDDVIERLNPKDYAKCSNIWDMKKHSDAAQKWYDQIVSGNRIVFIYKVNSAFIGEGALVFETGDADYTIPQQRIYLSRLIVKAKNQNRGIGGKIIDYLVCYARKLGYKELSLGVDIDNVSARHLYEKKGFTHLIFEGEDEQGKYVKLLKIL
jgi:Acetyltransferases